MKPARKAWSELGWQICGALAATALIAAVAGVALRGENTRDLTPCGEDPGGTRCAEQRQAVARAEPIRNPCIEHQRVEGTRGRNCPRFYVKRPGSQGPSFNAGGISGTQAPTGEGVNVPTGGDQDGSVQGGVGGQGDGHSGGHKSGPKSTEPSAQADSGDVPADTGADISTPGNSEGNGSSESSKANPVAEGVGSVVDGVGETVQETGQNANETVNGAVEGVTGKACEALGTSC